MLSSGNQNNHKQSIIRRQKPGRCCSLTWPRFNLGSRESGFTTVTSSHSETISYSHHPEQSIYHPSNRTINTGMIKAWARISVSAVNLAID